MTLTAAELVPDLATPGDDGSIQRLLAASSVPGYVELASERAPSYFLSCGTMGDPYNVGVVRRQASGEVVGLGYRGIQARFVNARSSRSAT